MGATKGWSKLTAELGWRLVAAREEVGRDAADGFADIPLEGVMAVDAPARELPIFDVGRELVAA